MNESNTIKQQGGTCVTIMEKYGEYVKEMGKDPSSLGRWSWIKVKGNNDITTLIISATYRVGLGKKACCQHMHNRKDTGLSKV